jgi:hypothetical protein
VCVGAHRKGWCHGITYSISSSIFRRKKYLIRFRVFVPMRRSGLDNGPRLSYLRACMAVAAGNGLNGYHAERS